MFNRSRNIYTIGPLTLFAAYLIVAATVPLPMGNLSESEGEDNISVGFFAVLPSVQKAMRKLSGGLVYR